jgi:hypothetical protein
VLPFPVELLRFLDQATTGLAHRSSLPDDVRVEGTREQTSAASASTEAPPTLKSQAAREANTSPLNGTATPPA